MIESSEVWFGCPRKKMDQNVVTWNAKCPIFLGNLTPKTSNYCLKNRSRKLIYPNLWLGETTHWSEAWILNSWDIQAGISTRDVLNNLDGWRQCQICFFLFILRWRKWSNFDYYVQMGWFNHQLFSGFSFFRTPWKLTVLAGKSPCLIGYTSLIGRQQVHPSELLKVGALISSPRLLGLYEGDEILLRMSQEVSKWTVNGLQPTFEYGIL